MTEPVRVAHPGREVLFHEASARGQNIGAFLRRGEFYEAGMLEYIRQLGVNGTYVDAGAAIGTHTLFFAAVCDASRVHSFEPRDWVVDLLRQNVELNGLEKTVTVHQIGLSDRHGEAPVFLDGHHLTIQTAPLDSIVDDDIALMKIDVEGMEVGVLNGAAELLKKSRPLLFVEATTARAYDDIKACLKHLGYAPTGRYFNSSPTFEFWPLETAKDKQRQQKAAANYAAIPRQRIPAYGVPKQKWSRRAKRKTVVVLDKHAPWLAKLLRRAIHH